MSKLIVKRVLSVAYPNPGDEIWSALDDNGWLQPRIVYGEVPSKWISAEQYSLHENAEAMGEQLDDEGGLIPFCISICDSDHVLTVPFVWGNADEMQKTKDILLGKLKEWHSDWDESYLNYVCNVFMSVNPDESHEEACFSMAEDLGREPEDVEFRGTDGFGGENWVKMDEDAEYDFDTLRACHVSALGATVDDFSPTVENVEAACKSIEWGELEQIKESISVACLPFENDEDIED